jgi:hypothetical protein
MRGIVGEERIGKEMDGCPLTVTSTWESYRVPIYFGLT